MVNAVLLVNSTMIHVSTYLRDSRFVAILKMLKVSGFGSYVTGGGGGGGSLVTT